MVYTRSVPATYCSSPGIELGPSRICSLKSNTLITYAQSCSRGKGGLIKNHYHSRYIRIRPSSFNYMSLIMRIKERAQYQIMIDRPFFGSYTRLCLVVVYNTVLLKNTDVLINVFRRD